MNGEATAMELKEQVLRHLREHYPIKVDEAVLISAIHASNKGASHDQISECIKSLKDEGLIEESFIKVPFGKMDTYRFKITPSGIENLQLRAGGGIRSPSATLVEIESRLADTYNCIKTDMEVKNKQLEESIKGLSDKIADLSKELAEVKGIVDSYVGKAEDDTIREEQLILRVLSGDERTIYDIILNAGGQMYQKDLVIRSRMSNAKISRIVDHLESRGVLIRERHGATNRLRIMVNPMQAKTRADPMFTH